MAKQVLIIGGGVVGLTAALGLSRLGHDVSVIDGGSLEVSALLSDFEARVYAINEASAALFKAQNVWSFIKEQRLSPYEKMTVWQASGGRLSFDSREVAKPELGFIIESKVIKNALIQALSLKPNVSLHQNIKLTDLSISEEKVVAVSKEENFHGQLLLACDGANSWVRKSLQVPVEVRPYGHHAMTATVKTAYPHKKTAYQCFTEDGPLAFLPLAKRDCSSIVWSASEEKINQLLKLDERCFCEALSDAFQHKLGDVSEVSQRFSFPLVERHIKHYIRPGVVFLGDAAHTIHPLAGLGVNLGLSDVACFLRVSEDGNNFSYSSLRKYERERKAANVMAIKAMAMIKQCYSPNGMPSWLRGAGMSMINQVSPIKKALMDLAAKR